MSRNIRSLTGIRGIAALWVMFGHFSDYLFSEYSFPQNTWLKPMLNNGFSGNAWAGVDLFFVLSGFIIAHNYLQGWTLSVNNILRFWSKRLARLYPVYLVTTLLAASLYFVAKAFGHHFKHYGDLSFGDFALNIFGLQQWFGVKSFNFPAWSVSAEFFAYLLFPLIAVSFLRTRAALTRWLWMAISVSILTVMPLLGSLNPSMWQVAGEFMVGGLMYTLSREWKAKFGDSKVRIARWASWPLVLVVLYYCGLIGEQLHSVVAVIFALIVWLYSLPGEEKSVLARSSAIKLGLWSYSLYLIHGLMMNVLSGVGHFGTSNVFINLLQIILLISVPVPLAGLSYKFLEEPCRNHLGRWIQRKLARSSSSVG